MVDSRTIERSVRRRIKRGGLPRRDHAAEAELAEVVWKVRHAGRVLDDGRDPYPYQVGGIRRLSRHVAEKDPEGDFVNGWSDKVDSPRRVQRRAKKSKGGRKGAAGVLR